MTGLAVATGVQAGTVTLVAVAVATAILTLFRINPSVRLAGKDIVTNTSDCILSTSSYTLTILTVI